MLAGLQDVGPLGDRERQVGVLLDDEHGGVELLVQVGETLEQVLGDDRRQAERRLVEQEQLRPQHQRPGHRQHLLLAPAEAAGLLAATLAEAGEHREPVVDVRADLGAVLAHVGAGLEVVLDRQLGERAAALRHVGDAVAHDRLGGLADRARSPRTPPSPWCRSCRTAPAAWWSCRHRWLPAARRPRPGGPRSRARAARRRGRRRRGGPSPTGPACRRRQRSAVGHAHAGLPR